MHNISQNKIMCVTAAVRQVNRVIEGPSSEYWAIGSDELATRRSFFLSVSEAGKTQMSAPVSTRNDFSF